MYERLVTHFSHCEVAGTLFAQEHTEKKDASRDKLEGKWNHPLLTTGSKVTVDSVRDPKSKNCTHLN